MKVNIVFAPHTRGSTHRLHATAASHVCPAHAGVYRVISGMSSSSFSFAPHTRGSTHDRRPWEYQRCRLPRTRGGLPCAKTWQRHSGLVCPAHAGVYLKKAGAGAGAGFAPHTRGSTERFSPLRTVCPAHAGVYPPASDSPYQHPGLPRTRGGLPSEGLDEDAVAFCPAHAGVYLAHIDHRAQRMVVCPAHAGVYRIGRWCHGIWLGGTVCPAHAGVYRSSPGPWASCTRLPRTRGGLPSLYSAAVQPHVCPAHAGVYRTRLLHLNPPAVCPAHAGVYPRWCGIWLGGTPAHAGVYRCLSRMRPAFAPHTRGSTVPNFSPGPLYCLPRTRGGLPGIRYPELLQLRLPRTRGGLPASAPVPPVAENVCPAHAGVYPHDWSCDDHGHGLPRTRGGLPDQAVLAVQSTFCPAHAGVYRRLICLVYPRRSLPRTRGGLPTP